MTTLRSTPRPESLVSSELTSQQSPARLAVLLSGRGSNFEALQAAIEDGRLAARIVLVLSNQKGAIGLETARRHGLDAICVPHRDYGSRAEHEAAVLEALATASPDWICLAGYMRLVSAAFVDRYRHRILNIHPSLLPAFPGLKVHEQVLDHGVRVSGCTVHLVDAELDNGPIVAQATVPVLDGDEPQTLAARVLAAEHDTYWRALQRLIEQPWRVEGRRLVFGQSDFSSPKRLTASEEAF